MAAINSQAGICPEIAFTGKVDVILKHAEACCRRAVRPAPYRQRLISPNHAVRQAQERVPQIDRRSPIQCAFVGSYRAIQHGDLTVEEDRGGKLAVVEECWRGGACIACKSTVREK